MKQLSDQDLAARMLQVRADNGYKFISFARKNTKGYAILIGYFVVLMIGFALLGRWSLFLFTLGILLGVLARDVGWLQGANRAWPFMLKVTNWDEVKKLSEENPSTNQSELTP